VNWYQDPATKRSPGSFEPMLNVSYVLGPGVRVSLDPYDSVESEFVSFRVLEIVTDTLDYERHSLSLRKIFRTLAPACTESPIFFHMTNSSSAAFRFAVDQLAEVGFEMIIYSFGSGFVLETADPWYLQQIADDVTYAQSKGLEVGGYDLICLDRGHGGYGGNVGDKWDRIDPRSGKLAADACYASGWVDKLETLILNFINKTRLSMLETDGPYSGLPCAAKNHSHHRDLSDSIYRQTLIQSEFYSRMRAMNVFVNQPDVYFYAGGNKVRVRFVAVVLRGVCIPLSWCVFISGSNGLQ